MAGGGGQMKADRTKRGSNTKRKKKKRVGFSVDLTPLVDITFLLLTFFMFTTTMAEPQVMEMKVPPEVHSDVQVKESLLLTIYVRNDNKIMYMMGMENEFATEIALEKIKPLAEQLNLEKDKFNELITALKVEEKANYGIIVNLLDELNLAEVKISEEIAKTLDEEGNPAARKRKFAISTVSEDDKVKMYPEGVPQQAEVSSND
jgi:biopolymer transport protein ExbD